MSQRPSAPVGPDGARWPGEPGSGERPGQGRPGEERPGEERLDGVRWLGEPARGERPGEERPDGARWPGEPARGERPGESRLTEERFDGARWPGEPARGERPGEERPGEEPDGEWPDDLWPDDDESPGQAGDSAGGGGPGGPPAASAMPRGGPGAGPRKRARPVTLALITLAAAAIGAGIVLVVDDLSSSSAPAAVPGNQPSYLAPGQHVGNGQPGANGGLPSGGPGGGAGGTASLFMIGKVTAVTSTSITIGGPGHPITAAVTGDTRVTGKVSSIGGVKVGDQVSAQMTQSGARPPRPRSRTRRSLPLAEACRDT
jgi:hypothetical protein